MRATVPTSTRWSPPPTSEPRAIRTTPNSPSVEAVRHQCPVAGLEDVEGQARPGEEHRGQREHAQAPVATAAQAPAARAAPAAERGPAAAALERRR